MNGKGNGKETPSFYANITLNERKGTAAIVVRHVDGLLAPIVELPHRCVSCSNVNCLVLTTPDSDPIAGSRRRKAAALRNNHVCFGPNSPTELTELRPDRTGRFSGRNCQLGPASFPSGPGPIGPVLVGPRAGLKARSVCPG